MEDQEYMKLALELAGKGCGWVSPNPMVGAVIVKDGRIIGKGYHEKYGQFHAERNALANCTEPTAGATLYVTLEPCCHYGKQPPCVEAIVAAGITRVVIGAGDPNPLVAGKGIQYLKEHGITVQEHVLEEECRKQNEVFFYYIQNNRPYVVMKYAMTLDGKIATCTGESKWITGEEARGQVHELRHHYRAIMVGVGTVLADDPMLTCRRSNGQIGRNPIRIVCDSTLRTPFSSKIVQTAKEVPTIIATCSLEKDRRKAYEERGCEVLSLQERNGHVDLNQLMNLMGERGVDSILLEGGATLHWAALESGIVQKVLTFIAPKLIGGVKAVSPIGGDGYTKLADAVSLKNSRVRQLGEDFLIESEVDQNVYRNHRGDRNH